MWQGLGLSKQTESNSTTETHGNKAKTTSSSTTTDSRGNSVTTTTTQNATTTTKTVAASTQTPPVGADQKAGTPAETTLKMTTTKSKTSTTGTELKTGFSTQPADGKLSATQSRRGGRQGQPRLGGSATVEVDVKQIGQMAKNTAVSVADANHDGKLGLDDAKAVADSAKKKVLGWLHL